MEKFIERVGSRKLFVAVVGFIAVIVNDVMGKPIDDDSMTKALGFLGAYIVGQGIADHGSQGKKKPIVVAYGEDEGPNWDQTADIDDTEDERRELLG